MNHKKLLYAVPAILLSIAIIVRPGDSMQNATQGILLWGAVVLPAIFPFMVAVGVLIRSGFAQDLSRALTKPAAWLFHAPGAAGYCLLMSALSGYPMGAFCISELYAERRLDQADCTKLMTFCSTSGPLFVIAAVGGGMFHNLTYGYLLLAAHYASALLNGIFYRGAQSPSLPHTPSVYIQGEYLSQSIEKAVKTCLVIGGFIAVFSVINGALLLVLNQVFELAGGTCPQALYASLASLLEMTNGCAQLAKLSDISLALPLTAAAISWGGFSILFQAYSLLSVTGVSAGQFITARLLQAGFGFLVCKILLDLSNGQYFPAIFYCCLTAAILLLPSLRRGKQRVYQRELRNLAR